MLYALMTIIHPVSALNLIHTDLWPQRKEKIPYRPLFLNLMHEMALPKQQLMQIMAMERTATYEHKCLVTGIALQNTMKIRSGGKLPTDELGKIYVPPPPPPPPLDTDRLRSATNSDGLLAVLGAAQVLRAMQDGSAKRRVLESIESIEE